jgi:uncharacterized membrane protein
VRAWFRLASSTLLSFAAVVVAVLAAATLGYALFRHTIPHSREIAAMLVGVYTGGTPNLAAIGTGLGVSSDTLVAVNAADVVVGGAYLLFLFTVAPRVYGWVLRPLRRPHGSAAAPSDLPAAPGAAPGSTAEPLPAPALETAPGDATTAASWETERPTWRSGSLALASAVGVLGGSVALAWLLPIRPFEVSAVLAVTTLSVAASLVPAIHRLRGSYALGQYLLLVFCVAVGSTARFDRFTAASLLVVGMLTFVMVGAALLHLGLAWVLRIDRDTALITSTAGIYGPAFVGPVAVALGNDRQVLFSGLACGLLGYAVGNYLGLGLAWVLG